MFSGFSTKTLSIVFLCYLLSGCSTKQITPNTQPAASDYLGNTNLALEIEFRKPIDETRLIGVYILNRWMEENGDIFQIRNFENEILWGSGQIRRSARWYNQSTNYFDFFAFENKGQLFIQFFNFIRTDRDGQEPFPISERDQMSITQIDQKLANFVTYSAENKYPLLKCIENTLNHREGKDYCRNLITNDRAGKLIEYRLY